MSQEYAGTIVISKCGHDKGSIYVVTAISGDKVVLVCNGENRPLNKPKHKNVTHLWFTKSRTAATNDEGIKRALREFAEQAKKEAKV